MIYIGREEVVIATRGRAWIKRPPRRQLASKTTSLHRRLCCLAHPLLLLPPPLLTTRISLHPLSRPHLLSTFLLHALLIITTIHQFLHPLQLLLHSLQFQILQQSQSSHQYHSITQVISTTNLNYIPQEESSLIYIVLLVSLK